MLRSFNSKQFHWLTFNLITTPHQVGNYLYIYDFLYIYKKNNKKSMPNFYITSNSLFWLALFLNYYNCGRAMT